MLKDSIALLSSMNSIVVEVRYEAAATSSDNIERCASYRSSSRTHVYYADPRFSASIEGLACV